MKFFEDSNTINQPLESVKQPNCVIFAFRRSIYWISNGWIPIKNAALVQISSTFSLVSGQRSK